MDIATTTVPHTENTSACTTVGTVEISVAHVITALPASQDVTMDNAE
jgi:hypothetical protein